MKKSLCLLTTIFLLQWSASLAQTKILFDATKAEMAGNADWVIDASQFNLGLYNGPAVPNTGNEANPARFPLPAQSGITTATAENYWNGGISYWGIDCVKKGYTVETLPYNGQITYGNSANVQDLSNYKVFIICEPNIAFTQAEKTALLNFVQNGGGLFMVSDHDQSDRNNDTIDSPAIWNDFMTNNGTVANPFGIAFNITTLSGNSTNVKTGTNPITAGIMGNVTQVLWSSGTSMTLSPSANSTVSGYIWKSGSSQNNNNVLCATAQYGNGKVAAIGDSSPCDDGTGDNNDVLYDGYITDAAGNHQKLLMNITIWLATVTTGVDEAPVPQANCWYDAASQNIRLQLPEHSGVTKAIVYDVAGKALSATLIDAAALSPTIPAQSLHTGLYIVALEGVNGVRSVKVVVQ